MERRRPAAAAAGDAGAVRTLVAWHHRGSSLVELLTSTLLLGILMAMSYGFARAALMSARVQEVKSEAQEVTVMAVDVLARELRTAGFSAAAQPLAAVRAADAEHVEVAADLNGDGDTDDSNEVVGYSYDATKSQLMRATGGGSPQPLVRNVPRGGLHFVFYDASGAEIAPGSGSVTPADYARIHRVDVLAHVELANPDPSATVPLTSTVSASICLRNQ